MRFHLGASTSPMNLIITILTPSLIGEERWNLVFRPQYAPRGAHWNFPYTTLLALEGYSVIGVAGKTGWDDEMSEPRFDRDEVVVCSVIALCLGNAALGIIYRLMA